MAQINLFDEIIVDNFAGGGGASTGIELASGRPVAIAINHDPDAILLHQTNHPYTEHLQASVWDVDPVEVCKGRPVGLAWFSPDCKHFSKAKGAALVDRNIRGLAWIVLRWAAKVRPRVIMLENVEEFVSWGPVRKGKPVKKKAGQTFQKWKQQLSDLGYDIDHRELVAADYGAPTTRKRFVLVARCDGKPIVWPKPTHGPRDCPEVLAGKLKPWRSAAEIIDWSLPGYSIFDTRQEIKRKYGVNAVRPLADNTLRRVIRGVDKFTIKSGSPFLVPIGYGERQGQKPRVNDIRDPLTTVVSRDKAGVCQPVVAPFTAECNHGGDGHTRSVEEPVNTLTGKYTGGVCGSVLAPFVAQQKFQNAPQNIEDPLSTITSVGAHELAGSVLAPVTFPNTCNSVGSPANDPVHTVTSAGNQILSAASLIQYHTETTDAARASGLSAPINTVDSSNRYGLTAANLVEYYGNGNPLNLREPMRTATSHDREGLVAAHITKYFDGGYKGCGDAADTPLSTVTALPRHGICAAHIVKYYTGVTGSDADEPLPTVTAFDHNALAAAHIAEFKGQDKGQSMSQPLRTITASAGEFGECKSVLSQQDMGHWPEIRALLNRFCGYHLAEDEVILLVIGGIPYFIADITLRMLTPRELYNAMGFPPDYEIEHDYTGKPYPKNQQVARCGNAVCPPMAEAMVRANLPEWCSGIRIVTMAQWTRAVAY